MYEQYTRQALPSKKYRELLGSALCVFNSNNAFVIENILRTNENNNYDWYMLIDKESGQLNEPISKTISCKSTNNISQLFRKAVEMRNRIIHSFQITDSYGSQLLATKTKVEKGNKQFKITEEYLLEFIALNEELSSALHEFRGF